MKNGEWRDYIELDKTEITTIENAKSIGTALHLDKTIEDRLSFYYQTYTGNNGIKKMYI